MAAPSPNAPIDRTVRRLMHYGTEEYALGNSGTAKTVNWDAGNTQSITLTSNCTFTFENPIVGFRYLLVLTQDGTGSRTVTWPAAVKWSGATAPTLTTTAAGVDVVSLVYTGASTYLAASLLDLR